MTPRNKLTPYTTSYYANGNVSRIKCAVLKAENHVFITQTIRLLSVVTFWLKRHKIIFLKNHRISELIISLDRYKNVWTNQKHDFGFFFSISYRTSTLYCGVKTLSKIFFIFCGFIGPIWPLNWFSPFVFSAGKFFQQIVGIPMETSFSTHMKHIHKVFALDGNETIYIFFISGTGTSMTSY